MPTKKQLTQEELFPHTGFPYRLETIEPDGTKKGTKRIAWFQCEWHLTKHVNRYRITEGKLDVQDGADPLSCNPLAPKPKRTRKAPAKAKSETTTKKPSRTKASQTSKTKKPAVSASKTKSTTRATKKAKKEVFSSVESFFE